MVLNLMLAHADSAGARWLAWVTTASLEAALLFLLVGLVWLAVRSRLAPQVGYGLFLLVPLKLLVPVTVPTPPILARWTPTGLVASWSRPAAPGTTGSPAATPPAATLRRLDGPSRGADGSMQPPVVALVVAAPASPPAVPRPGPVPAPGPGPVGSLPAGLATDTHGLSWAALAMTVWGAAVVVLTGRFAVAQWRFRARLRRASPVDLSQWAVDFGALCRSAGVSPAVRLMETDGVAAPAVWGMLRPTILMPQGIAETLTEAQLRWVLLHELAHVRRRDLVVVTLQRVVSVLHFFNPVVWVANRVIHELREYACDDTALALGQASAVESGEAFVRVLRHAAGGRRGLEGELGVFGLDSRTCCLRRVRRLLDGGRPIRTATGARWGVAWFVLAALTVPHLRADGGSRPQPGPQKPAAASGKITEKVAENEVQTFELRVVGPGGRSLPSTEVELRIEPSLTAEQVRRGTFVRQKRYGTVVATDAEGRLAVALPREPKSLDVFITTPGFGPYWAGWSSRTHVEPIPPSFTAELEPAWTVGGVVVDDAGKPVAGATVFPSIEFKKRPGVTTQFGSGTEVKTDDAGRWHFDSVPDSMGEVSVSINHPPHMPVQRFLARSGFGLERGREPTARIALPRGVTVSGKVTDESGAPLAGARVRTKFSNSIREATTGPDGVYHLAGCEPKAARVVVWAKGKATDMKELNLDPAMGPVDFRMKPGGTVRIRVVDAQGKPVPRARIFFQKWRGPFFQYFEFDPKDQYADENGVWEWHEAPLDEVKADICPPQGMQLTYQTITARPEEYVFKVSGPLVVSGKVVDAATGKPVESFRVVPGWRSAPDHLSWDQRGGFSAAGGRYEIRQDRVDSALLVRIEADSYQAAVSRDIRSTEGRVTVDFALQPGKGIAATVLAPDGRPAAKARIALGINGSQIEVRNGDINGTSTFAAQTESDAAGRFHFAAQDAPFVLVVTHPSGFGFIHSGSDRRVAETIRLEPWARVEGTFRIGKAAVGGVSIRLDSNGARSFGPGVPNVTSDHTTVTGPDGRFVFERVIPGKGGLSRNISLLADSGATEVTSSCWVATDLPAGKTVHVDLGGSGRPVVGKLLPAAGAEVPIRWSFAEVRAMPADAETRAKRVSLTATVDRNGAFHMDDVPAGRYTLMVRFDQHDAGTLREHPFEVPPSGGDAVGPPVDLGVLQLKRR